MLQINTALRHYTAHSSVYSVLLELTLSNELEKKKKRGGGREVGNNN